MSKIEYARISNHAPIQKSFISRLLKRNMRDTDRMGGRAVVSEAGADGEPRR